MYYRTCPLHAVRNDLTASGFTVTTVPLTALGRRENGSPRYGLVLARKPRRPATPVRRSCTHRSPLVTNGVNHEPIWVKADQTGSVLACWYPSAARILVTSLSNIG